jgi:hypothetical protein
VGGGAANKSSSPDSEDVVVAVALARLPLGGKNTSDPPPAAFENPVELLALDVLDVLTTAFVMSAEDVTELNRSSRLSRRLATGPFDDEWCVELKPVSAAALLLPPPP